MKPLTCADLLVIAACLYVSGLLAYAIPAGLYYAWRYSRG